MAWPVRIGPAPGLRQVADEKSRPADAAGILGQSLEVSDQPWMTPMAVARQPHYLPSRTIDR